MDPAGRGLGHRQQADVPHLCAKTWLADRRVKGEPLKVRTREHYAWLLDEHLSTFGAVPIASITADDVRAWHTRMDKATPTAWSHAYGLLNAMMNTAVSDGKAVLSPCVIRGAGTSRRVHKIRPATLGELATLTEAMPAPYQAMILLASWCALRFGELTELRRKDIELTAHTEHDDDGNPWSSMRVWCASNGLWSAPVTGSKSATPRATLVLVMSPSRRTWCR